MYLGISNILKLIISLTIYDPPGNQDLPDRKSPWAQPTYVPHKIFISICNPYVPYVILHQIRISDLITSIETTVRKSATNRTNRVYLNSSYCPDRSKLSQSDARKLHDSINLPPGISICMQARDYFSTGKHVGRVISINSNRFEWERSDRYRSQGLQARM